MTSGRLGVFVVACGLATAAFAQDPAAIRPRIPKKLIEYGWDVPTPDFIRAHIREMEQRPFDGIIFRFKAGNQVFQPTPWDEAAFAQDLDDLANIAWERFTDNFAILLAASDIDWFDDDQWRAVETNATLAAKAARIGRCVGLCFDPEPYGTNPWDYAKAIHRDAKTFAEYEAEARQRGAQFIAAVEREFPNPKILAFYLLGLFSEWCRPMPADERAEKLSRHDYGLWPAFVAGMLDAGSPGMSLIDGNENAYYYHDAPSYFDAYHRMTQRALYMLDPALWPKYRAQVRAGQALYADQYFGLRTNRVLGHYLTQREQPLWMEHNTYWALFTTDEYVWCYSERMNWWTSEAVPEGCENAIRSARDKIAAGRPLDLDIQPFVKDALSREQGGTEP